MPFDAAASVKLQAPLVGHYGYIAACMRADEIAQYLAATGDDVYEADTAARVFLRMPGPHFGIFAGATPLCIGGFQPLHAGVYQTWMAGTPAAWAKHWRSITKHCRHVFDQLLEGDARRIQTIALASRTQTCEWYERGLGMTREGVLRGYFANGDDAVCYARVNDA